MTAERRLRAGVLSAGAWSETSHLPALAADPGVDLIAVTSPERETAQRLASAFGAESAFVDWREALDLDLDLVVVSSPPYAHAEQVLSALASGAHVLVEKPMAIEPSVARELASASDRFGRHLVVGFGWARVPAFRLARDIVRDGRLGRLEQVSIQLAVNNRGLLTGAATVAWTGAGSYEPTTYTDVRRSGGGAGAVAMSHQFGLLRWIVGERVHALTAIAFPDAERLDLHGQALVRWGSGASGAVVCSSVHETAGDPAWELLVMGEAGELWLKSRERILTVRDSRGDVEDVTTRSDDFAYSPTGPTRELVRLARGAGEPDGLDAWLGVETVDAVDAYYRSARERRWIDLPVG